MKNRLYLSVDVVIALLLLVACSDYPDELGLEGTWTEGGYQVTKVRADGYDVELDASFQVSNEGSGIERCGFIIDDEKYDGEFERKGGLITVKSVVPNLHYNRYYDCIPFIISDGVTFYSKLSDWDFRIEKDGFDIKLENGDVIFVWSTTDDPDYLLYAGKDSVKLYSYGKGFIETATVSLGNMVKDGIVVTDKELFPEYYRKYYDYDFLVYAQFSLNDVKANSPISSGSIVVANGFDSKSVIFNSDLLSQHCYDTSLYLSDANTLKSSCSGYLPVSSATFSFAGQTKKGVLGQYGYYSADFDLCDLLPSSTPYSGVTVVLNGVFGEYKENLSYSVLVEKTISFDDDGDKGDCVRIAGIDWAKGNLACDNGKWIIGNQTDRYSSPNTSAYGTYFSFGNTEMDNVFHGWSKNISDIQGNPDYDVVAAHIPGWMLPSKDDFSKLITYASVLSTYGGIMFTPSKEGKRFYSNSAVSYGILDAKDIILLPCNGIYSKDNGVEDDFLKGYYMSSTAAYYGPYYSMGYGLNNNELNNLFGLSGYYDSEYKYATYKFNVRPVKKREVNDVNK